MIVYYCHSIVNQKQNFFINFDKAHIHSYASSFFNESLYIIGGSSRKDEVAHLEASKLIARLNTKIMRWTLAGKINHARQSHGVIMLEAGVQKSSI